MQLHETLEQGSDEWHNLRLGKITGSGFVKLMGKPETKERYLSDRAAEVVTGSRCDSDSFSTVHTERGHEFEDIARMKYTIATLNDVKSIGLVQLNEYVSCSPDGLVDNDGLIEIKVPDSNNYFRSILEFASKGSDAIPREHYMQMQFNMYVCDRKWCDYVIYSPAHEVNNKALYIHRVYRDHEEQEKIKVVIEKAIQRIEECVNLYKNLEFN